jgi:hypothetical protein
MKPILKTAGQLLPFGGLGLVANLLHIGKKKPAQPSALPLATRDDAAAAADAADALRRRRGGAADIVTGAYGAEPLGGTGKATLGS